MLGKFSSSEDPVNQALSAIHQQSVECASTIRRIQLFSRPVSRNQLSQITVNELVLNAVEIVEPFRRDKARQQKADISLETRLESLPAVMGHGNSFKEALGSLLTNAVEALPNGGVVSVSTRAEGKTVLVEVKDTGVGMDAKMLAHCFEPFYTTKGPSYSGIGLCVARNLITQRGGTIGVESQPGKGTKFIIRLPVAEPAVAVPKPARTVRNQNQSLSVLVVDDERHVAQVVKAFLEDAGHQVTVCQDGHEALKAFGQQDFDLAVVDLGMPGMDGWEVCRWLNRRAPSFPILIATGWDVFEDDAPHHGVSIQGVLQKPFSIERLRQAVERATRVPERVC